MKAFPTVNWVKQHGQPPNDEGMDLRDYFAAKALQGMATWGKDTLELIEKRMGIDDYWDYVADYAYLAADAMMEARKK